MTGPLAQLLLQEAFLGPTLTTHREILKLTARASLLHLFCFVSAPPAVLQDTLSDRSPQRAVSILTTTSDSQPHDPVLWVTVGLSTAHWWSPSRRLDTCLIPSRPHAAHTYQGRPLHPTPRLESGPQQEALWRKGWPEWPMGVQSHCGECGWMLRTAAIRGANGAVGSRTPASLEAGLKASAMLIPCWACSVLEDPQSVHKWPAQAMGKCETDLTVFNTKIKHERLHVNRGRRHTRQRSPPTHQCRTDNAQRG